AGEVLAEPHAAVDREDLLLVDGVAALHLHVAPDREARGRAALVGVVGVVEADALLVEVVLPDDAGAVVLVQVRRRAHAERARGSDAALVLAHRARALAVAVLAEAVGLVELDAAEGVVALLARAPEEEEAVRVERAECVPGGEPALGEA